MTVDLPPSLAVTPNIPYEEQSIEQLQAERDFWHERVQAAPSWGAALGVLLEYRNECDAWLEVRRKERSQ